MADVIAGRFSLIDPIARGGAGTVWRAWDLRTERVCAAKVLRGRDSTDLLRFIRECSAAIDHPRLVAPFGWAAEDMHVAIAMPLVAGGSLAGLLKTGGPLDSAATALILRQLLEGLEALHAEGWVHRDVKPGNVLLEATGGGVPCARLADFGISVRDGDVRFTRTGLLNGTSGYLAPELFEPADPAPPQDLYAAGVVGIAMLLGRRPRRDRPLDENGLARLLEPVDPHLLAVITGLVRADPAERYASATAALADLPSPDPGVVARHRDGVQVIVPDRLPPLPDGVRLPSPPPARVRGPALDPGGSSGPGETPPPGGGGGAIEPRDDDATRRRGPRPVPLEPSDAGRPVGGSRQGDGEELAAEAPPAAAGSEPSAGGSPGAPVETDALVETHGPEAPAPPRTAAGEVMHERSAGLFARVHHLDE